MDIWRNYSVAKNRIPSYIEFNNSILPTLHRETRAFQEVANMRSPIRKLRVIFLSLISLTVAMTLFAENTGRNFVADLPPERGLRTACLRMDVYPNSQIASNTPGYAFSYFGDSNDYIYDGYLILGNSAANLSYSTSLQGTGIPTPSNPFGYLYPDAIAMTIDSVSYASHRVAAGKGYNRDSTIMFDVRWFAAKHPDTCNSMVAEFKIYKGPNGGTVTGLTIAYYVDVDVPADSFSRNYCGVDPSRSMVYQRGASTDGPNNNASRYAAMAGLSYRRQIIGGLVLPASTYIYPEAGVFENDSIWNRMSILQDGQYSIAPGFADPGVGTGPATDLVSVLVLDRNQTVTSSDTLYYGVVLAGQSDGGTLTSLKNAIDKGLYFAADHNLVPGAFVEGCLCGDANNSGGFTISDVVYIITAVFAGGPLPSQPCLGDANGSGDMSVSDAVFLIGFHFFGGPVPHCP